MWLLWLMAITFLDRMPLQTSKTYILSEQCRPPLTNDSLQLYSNTKHLRIDNLNDTLILYSHRGVITERTDPLNATRTYPHDFSCEVVVYTSLHDAKIMLRIDKFHVPSASKDCRDNYLYIFDSNNAKSKAMPEAGGETGLCQSAYPRFPIFTTHPVISIAFHTSVNPSSIPHHHDPPGFRLVLTVIRDTTSSTCPSNDFYCGLRPSFSTTHLDEGVFSERRFYSGSRSVAVRPSDETSSSILGYCIPLSAVCDGILNCADGRDEDADSCSERERVERDWLSGFLSLGIPASLAIAVSTIVTFTVCFGTIVCCCHRCCKPPSRRDSSNAQGQANNGRTYQALVQMQKCSTGLPENAPIPDWPTGGGGRQPPLTSGAALSANWPHFHGVPFSSVRTDYLANARSTVQSPPIVAPPLPSSASTGQSPHYDRKTTDHTNFYHAYSTQASLSTPDNHTLDSCSYTPPVYEPCVVPPASSASSRTGTSGGGRVTMRGSRFQSSKYPGQANPTASSSSSGLIGAGIKRYPGDADVVITTTTTTSSNGMLGDQVVFGGNHHPALRNNTPVETISRFGTDLSANGGIVYLGEMASPFCGPTDCPASVKTGSGSSQSRRYCQRRRAMQNARQPGGSGSGRRPRVSSHHRYRHRDQSRTQSSGSQTPASFRSGLPSSSLCSASDPMETISGGLLPSSASFSVQL